MRAYLGNSRRLARHGQPDIAKEDGRHGGAHERRFAAHVCARQQHDAVAEVDVVVDRAVSGHV